MAEREQIKPLAPLSSSPTRFNNYEDEAISGQLHFRRKRCIQCCGCLTAFILILAVIILALAFTVFTVKEPDIRLNGVTTLNSSITSQDRFTLLADVSVKNPNAFTFRFGNTTTIIYYDKIRIGEGQTPPGKVKARRSSRLNVTLDISISGEVLESASLRSDLSDLAVNISSYTRIDGKVKVLNLLRKTVVVEMNCTIEYNFTRGSTHGENCRRRVEL